MKTASCETMIKSHDIQLFLLCSLKSITFKKVLIRTSQVKIRHMVITFLSFHRIYNLLKTWTAS